MLKAEVNELLTRTGPGTPMGELFRQLLDSGAAGRGAAGERLRAGAGEAAVGAPARLPRHGRPLRPDRRVLRPPGRLAVVRAQRGGRDALRLPRLEVRRRPASASTCRPSRPNSNFCAKVKLTSLSAGRARRHPLDLHGPPEQAPAAARIRVCLVPRGAALHLQAPAGMQLAAGASKAGSTRAMFLAALAAASRTTRSSRARRATSTT